MTITEFLLARIAEDEAVARVVGGLPWAWADIDGGMILVDAEALVRADGSEVVRTRDSEDYASWLGGDADQFKAWCAAINPARVLAECASKRAIIEQVTRFPLFVYPSDFTKGVLESLALPYTDHPDYDEAWRP